jgi:NAD(P)-dependent dehydrogenase (short-subunit alcohol dehydrogenase family)
MTQKWALITGSSRGLGFEIALALAENGFHTVITGRNPQSLESAAEKITAKTKTNPVAVCVDLVEAGGPEKLYARLNELSISPSVIVNCLGGSIPEDRRNIPTEILRASIRLNLEVGIEINNLFYDDLRTNHGIVVHIGSTASLHHDAPPGYVISKAAINAYVKNAARTFGREGVCIFAVLPGILDHEGSYINRMKEVRTERYKQALSESIFSRFTNSEETARFIVKSIEAGTPMLNGAIIQFDGGKD